MNTQIKRNECINLVRLGNRKINEIRFGENEGPEHKAMKEKICNDLIKQKKHFICEPIFITGGRADIFVLDDFKVIEIIFSEKLKSIQNKIDTYPEGLKMEVIDCKTNKGYGIIRR